MRKQPVKALTKTVCGRKRSRRGMTLIEVMVAMAIFSLTILWALQAILGAVAFNRALMASMTGDSVLRGQAEEVYAVAVDAGLADGAASGQIATYAEKVITYYGNEIAQPNGTSGNDVLPIGPNGSDVSRVSFNPAGTLTYRFALPEPGEHLRALVATDHYGTMIQPGEMIPYRRGVGEMVLYLDERLMPADPTDPALPAGSPLWTALGFNTASGGVDAGMPNGPFAQNVLRNPGNVGFSRVIADISVTYYSDDAQTKELFTNTRRVLINGELSDLFILSGTPAEG